jgi:hypothetical protein
MQSLSCYADSCILERFPNSRTFNDIEKGGFYFHPCDEDPSQGTPTGKSHLAVLLSGYSYWRTAIPASMHRPSRKAKPLPPNRLAPKGNQSNAKGKFAARKTGTEKELRAPMQSQHIRAELKGFSKTES